MNCLGCGHPNPATVSYCQKCGAKLNITADEIQASLAEKAKQETARTTEHYARQALIFAIILFLVAMTALVATGGAPEGTYFIPSSSRGADYLKVNYRFQPRMEPILIPTEEQ